MNKTVTFTVDVNIDASGEDDAALITDGVEEQLNMHLQTLVDLGTEVISFNVEIAK